MKKVILVLMLFFAATSVLFASQEYLQKDGLFKISIPDGWTGQEMSGQVVIVPPPLNGGGIVIKFKTAQAPDSFDAIKARISSSLETIAEFKVKPNGGSVIENSEIAIDNVYARCLYYTVSMKGELMYFFRILFENNGYAFSIDYGNHSKEEVDKILELVKTFRF